MLHNLTVKKYIEGIKNKEFSIFEIIKEIVENYKAKDENLGVFLSFFKDEILEKANFYNDFNFNEEDLFGLPIAIKDNILIKGKKTTAASLLLKNYIASYSATVIEKLEKYKPIFVGKTNLDEFAMGSSNENSAFKITKNPLDEERVPGGSSGGSAASLVADLALAALGSDTGGSIRQPAAFCGVVGFKPTYGTVSRFGLIAMASSLDQIGPITKTVEDAEIIFSKIAGVDEKDETTTSYSYHPIKNLEEVKKLKIGLPKEYFAKGMNKEIEEGIEFALQNIKKLNFEIKEISLPHTQYALSVYYIIMPAEVSTNLARFDGIRYCRNIQKDNLENLYLENRSFGFGSEVKRRIVLGTFVLSSGYYDAYYLKAQKVRKLIADDFEKAFKEVDLILTPVTPTLPFKIGEKTKNPLDMYLSDIFTIPANLAEIPALSLPTGFKKEKFSVNFQIMGKKFEDNKVLAFGKFYEKNIG
jgi:aspartyl-tRNA(Asn)/glutamyl-tRNA(Gln) amidotransferase subunit A